MFPLPEDITIVIASFAPLFSERVWSHAQVLLIGAILAPCKRTVSAALRVMGLSQEERFTNYHRVLNRAVWSACMGSRILLGLLIALLPAGIPLVLAADDTVERRSGKKIKGIGCYRDAVRSTKKHVVRCFGLKWVCMMLIVPVPWSSRVWAMPFLTALCEPEAKEKKSRARGKKQDKAKGSKRRHKTSVDWVRQMIKQVHRWHPTRLLVLVVDGAFAAVSLAWACKRIGTTFVSRLRWDAALYHPPQSQPAGKKGRKPQKGKRQRRLKTWANRSDTPWEEQEVLWYGSKRKKMLFFSRKALWYRPGWPPLPIRFVIIRDPEGNLDDEVFFCTDPDASPVQIIEWVVMRWSAEVTFEEARAHLGMETQRQWADLAIQKTTPCLLALFSIVTLLTMRLMRKDTIPVQTTAWYPKQEPTFSDCILLVRHHIWRARFLVNSAPEAEFVPFPKEMLDLLWMYDLPLVA